MNPEQSGCALPKLTFEPDLLGKPEQKQAMVASASSNSQVGPDTRVVLSYTAYDAEGDEVDRSDAAEPVVAIFGYAQLLPKVEAAIEGLQKGQSRTVVLSASDAFGERDQRAVLEVDRTEFPEDVQAGDHYEVENQQGELLVFKVLDVGKDYVVLDTNHPLAGQQVRLDLVVRDVRPATSDEIAIAQEHLASSKASLPNPTLVGVERLIRGRTQH